MLVIPEQKALVLKVADKDRVLSAIPNAKTIQLNGTELVAVPHRRDETAVLRNLGIEAPAPIHYHYRWPGKFKPYVHQSQTAAFLTMQKKGLVLNDIGTGKTMSALWAADFLMETKAINKVLIMSPLSTLERVWADTIFMNFPHRRSVTLHGTAERRLKLLDADVDFYIVNHDGFSIIADKAKNKFDLIIVDEAAVLRNPGTERFKQLRKFMEKHPNMMLWLMTGTPTPNSPEDAWTLARLVESPTLNGLTYTSFRDKVMMKVGQWRYLPRPSSPEFVASVLQPSVRFTRDECLDLPDTTYQTRTVRLSKDQTEAYKNMMKSLVAEADQGLITAANEAIKMQKLVQIAAGVAYGPKGEVIEIDASPRVNLIKELIYEVGGKVILFVPLTGTLHMLERELSEDFTVGVVNGETPAHKRNETFRKFQDDPRDPRVLLAHPATMAHGLTLTSASTIIWYAPITSNEIYTQANGRIERIGKTQKSTVVHVESTKLESKMYDRLKNKQKLQGTLLDIIGEGN